MAGQEECPLRWAWLNLVKHRDQTSSKYTTGTQAQREDGKKNIQLLYTREWEETQTMRYWEEEMKIQGKTSGKDKRNHKEPQAWSSDINTAVLH